VNSAQFARRVVRLVNKNRTDDFSDFENKLESLVERHGPRIGVNRLVRGLAPPPKCRYPGIVLTQLRVQAWQAEASQIAAAAAKGKILPPDKLDDHFVAWFPEVKEAIEAYESVASIRDVENVAFRAILASPAFQALCGEKANAGDKNYLGAYVIDQKGLVDDFHAHIFREVWNPNRDQFLRVRDEPAVAVALQAIAEARARRVLGVTCVRDRALIVRDKLARLLAEQQ
jgi:hypothetical protein